MRPSHAVAALALSFGMLAHADTGYEYTGQAFIYEAQSPYTSADRVTGTLTLANPLNTGGLQEAFTPVSFSFTDGVQTIDSLNATYSSFTFMTDPGGLLEAFAVLLEDQTASSLNLISLQNGFADQDFVENNGAVAGSGGPGTLAPTPEPASFALLGTGLLGAVAARRRQQA